MANDDTIEKPLHAGQLTVGCIKGIGVIEGAEVVIDSGLLYVGADPAPFDVWVLKAIRARTIGAERFTLWKGILQGRQDGCIQDETLQVQPRPAVIDFDP